MEQARAHGGAARGVALATLAAACVLLGPAPAVVAAMERIYAVAVVERDRRSRRRPLRRLQAPAGRRPGPARP